MQGGEGPAGIHAPALADVARKGADRVAELALDALIQIIGMKLVGARRRGILAGHHFA